MSKLLVCATLWRPKPCVSDSVGEALLAFACAPGPGSAGSGVGRCVGREVFLHVGISLSYQRNPSILFIQIITRNRKGLKAGAWYI